MDNVEQLPINLTVCPVIAGQRRKRKVDASTGTFPPSTENTRALKKGSRQKVSASRPCLRQTVQEKEAVDDAADKLKCMADASAATVKDNYRADNLQAVRWVLNYAKGLDSDNAAGPEIVRVALTCFAESRHPIKERQRKVAEPKKKKRSCRLGTKENRAKAKRC